MKKFFTCLFALITATSIFAQNSKEEQLDYKNLPQGLQLETDSLYLDWISKQYIDLGENCKMTPNNPEVSDSVYMDRLQRIPSIIEMPYNEIVRQYIDMYASRLRYKVAFMLSANNLYMPLFEEALDLNDLPQELRYLPVIESALNPMAISRQGAVGLWQFMLHTGKAYGLKYNSLVDERRDPYKSTQAAARYLKDLYDIYHDWNLVLAAYNCGPGTINKAIRRSGGEKDFWALYNYLPKETRSYVPAFIAANYIMTYYCDHDISPAEMKMPAGTDTIQINRNVHLQQIADVCQMNIDELRALNPQYRKDIIPGNTEPYVLRLPTDYIGKFIDLQDSIYAYKEDVYNNKRKTVSVKAVSNNSSNGKAVYHRIRNGETLGGIAAKYGVSVSQLRRLNGLKNNNIRAGRSLRIR